MLQNVGAECRVHPLPAAQVGGRLVQEVAVAGGQQVSHEDDGGADGHQEEQLTRPALVHILRALWGRIEDESHSYPPQ